MNSLNKVQLIGNVTAQPEIKETPSGQKVASFSLATNRVYKDANGEKQDQAEYHNIVVWGNLAGIVESYVGKGKKVYIEGRLQTRSWEDQSGVKKYKTEIVCESLLMLSGGEAPSAPKSDKASPAMADEIFIDDIPF
jgi:single-strand DNA-binding protein